MMQNPVTYFEIPVTDMGRAIEFYEAMFTVELERVEIGGHDMALFPFAKRVRLYCRGAMAITVKQVATKTYLQFR